MTENVQGKVVVITGASSGLGEATARMLAENGARVALGARRGQRIQSLADELNIHTRCAIAVRTDVADRTQVQHLVDRAIEEFGRVDVIVNNAGVMPLSRLEELDVAGWNEMIDINLKGVLHGIAAVLPHMKARQHGHIINVASTAGHRVAPTTAVYSATKYAVRALSEGLRQEVTPYNIRCTIISPGACSTELVSGVTDPSASAALRDVDSFALPASAFARMVAFAIAQPEEVDVNEILFRPTAQEK
ncbi:SDR family oxidoreductase [Burkholderia multivorans]|uniref:SDR family oxidoreductase n=1 Tax=Burkholderia multivorans TaxID=87883 RepID=UPI00075C821F|nr:SDR family oxidoreductase [Burkholderia multivorans]KWH26319.1 oxidoreductase [Burkholderia multivorans]